MFGYVVCMSHMKAGFTVLYLKHLLQSSLFTYADDPGGHVRVWKLLKVWVSRLRLHIPHSKIWLALCDDDAPPSACVFYCSVCVCWSARPSWQGKGNTRAVFVQGTGLALVAHTYTYKHARTHLAKTEAYCGLQAQFGPPTTVTHCITFCILSLPFISFYLFISLSITD